MSLIFVFLDGVGLAQAGPDNPLTLANMPALCALLGGPLTIERAQFRLGTTVPAEAAADVGRWTPGRRGDGLPSIGGGLAELALLLKPIDATLGMPGLPQSGTGQVALLAGFNAAQLHGRHQPHFPPVALRPLLAERSVLRRVVARGRRALFANAFGPRYWQAVAARRIRRSASVIAAEGAGLRFRDMDDLCAGRAMAWDVTGAALHEREPDAGSPLLTPQQAGANLARLADDHELVFYESFLPDLAGHGRLTTGGDESEDRRSKFADGRGQSDDLPSSTRDIRASAAGRQSVETQIQAAMGLLDGLIGGVLRALRPQDTLLISSDHGNVESLAAPAHTRNPVPLLVAGPAAAAFRRVESIAEVADVIDEVIL
jgi:2,3-bisphosphoglycerate-independent phosphoglycerate mutase